jgi:hypothetical protein
MPMSAPKLLSIYLRDHHAGAVAGVNVAHRAARQNESTAYGGELAQLAKEIEADKEALENVMSALEVGSDQVKDSAAWIGERLGRLKPNGRWIDYSPLSRLEELEGLLMGVTAKLGLWRSLERTHGPSVDGIVFAELSARAEDQRARLEELRLRAAEEALRSD